MGLAYLVVENGSDRILYRKCQYYLRVQPHHNAPIAINLSHFCLQRSSSNDIQSLENRLQKRRKHQRKNASLETSGVNLWPFVAKYIQRVVENDIRQVSSVR